MIQHTKAFSGFSVNDLKKARAFYADTLGMNVKFADTPMPLLEIHINPENVIMVYPKPDHTPASFTILNLPVDDVEQTVSELSQKGVTFEHYDGVIGTDEKGISRGNGGPTIAWFKDPAGNILSVLETI